MSNTWQSNHPVSLFRTRVLVFASGERFPILQSRDTGDPDYCSTLFILQLFRTPGASHNSIKQVLAAVSILYSWLQINGIDLRIRCSEGTVLSLGEIESLARTLYLRTSTLAKKFGSSVKRASVITAEDLLNTVRGETAAIRMTYVACFIDWFTKQRLNQMSVTNPCRAMLEATSEQTTMAILERRPRGNSSDLFPREGLDRETEAHIMKITRHDNPNNPYKQTFSRVRNSLIFAWFEEFGMRRSELAGVRIRNLSHRMTRLEIIRRSDDPGDPRADQPNAKTLERVLQISPQTADATRDYILNHRRHIAGAAKHDFLFVATGSGRPLSCSAINKIFGRLRERVPGLPAVTPHVFRHTWNDRFSEAVDSKELRMSDTAEQEARSYWMGWSPTSQTAATYTKRHVRERTSKVIRKMQEKAEEDDE